MKKLKSFISIVLVFVLSSGTAVFASAQTGLNFRVALSLGQGVEDNFAQGIVYTNGNQTATNSTELQQMYRNAGSTEMFVRIANGKDIMMEIPQWIHIMQPYII